MLAALDTDTSPVEALDINPPTLPLQPHTNGNISSTATSAHDPFNPKPKPLNGVYAHVGVVLDKAVAPEWETPPAHGSRVEEDMIMMMDDVKFDHQVPHAPPRRVRTLYSFQRDQTADIPRMRSITTRSKAKAESDNGEVSEASSRPTTYIPISHKRTVSGQTMLANPAVPANPAISASTVTVEVPQRRSDRLLRSRILPSTARLAAAVSRDGESRQKREVRKTKAMGTHGKPVMSVGRVVSGNRKPLDLNNREAKETTHAPSIGTTGMIKESARRAGHQTAEAQAPKEALVFLLDQYCKMGQGFLALSNYESDAAIAQWELLPPGFRETPWLLAQMARAYFEKSAYAEAENLFLKIRKQSPSRTEDMELYSTVLWHQRKDVDLAYLSHELIEIDRLAPQAWCALGNAFSLQGEHDQAIKCFKRASQLDPRFAYAYTLAGHEHVANEEFDKALAAFRNSISAENRHYNGWYGLGRVFEKLGKFEIARDHYMNAAKINPLNPVLKVCIGFVLEKTCIGLVPEKQRRREMALQMYRSATELDSKSAKARFAMARVLLILHRPREAFNELDRLKDMMPDEADVHFLLARVYKALGNTTKALQYFTMAMNLDPSATNLIKESLETLDESDGDVDDDDLG